MFAYQEIVSGVKSVAKSNPSDDYSHCQLLDQYSRNLGFENFHQLKTSLKALPKDKFGQLSTRLMRKVCAQKLPSQDSPYFEFLCHPDGATSFYSYWIGWDRFGREVRVPRPLSALRSVKGLRDQNDAPVYILESSNEVLAWKYGWKGTAYMPESLAREFFAFAFNKRHLVDEHPNMELVEKNCSFEGNFCRN